MDGDNQLRRSGRETKKPDRFSPSWESSRKKKTGQEALEDDVEGVEDPNRPKTPPAAHNQTFFGKMLSMTPFGGRRSVSQSSTSSSSTKRAQAEVETEMKMAKVQEEIDSLQETLDLSQAELKSLEKELSRKEKMIDPKDVKYDPTKVDAVKAELILLEDNVARKELENEKLAATTKRMIQSKKRELVSLEKGHQLTLAEIEEAGDQLLSSDDELDKGDIDQKVKDWKIDGPPKGAAEDSSQAPPNPLDLIAKTLEKLATNQSSPSTEKFIARQAGGKDLPHFSGKPEEWPQFIAEYNNTTKMCQYSGQENMQRLRKCLKGEAYKAVQCLMVSPENIDKVIETLKTRFGQAKHVIDSLIKKAKSTPPVKEDKLQTLIEFGTAVINLTSTIKSLNCPHHMNNPILLEELSSKMPSSNRMQWVEWVSQNEKREQNLEFFTEWVETKVRFACEIAPPIFKDEKPDDDWKKDKWQKKPERKPVAVNATEDQHPNHCNVCSKNGHCTNQCRILKSLGPDDRMAIVLDKSLCLSCLMPGCSSRKCPFKVPCNIDGCKYFHHRILHGTTMSIKEILSQKSKPKDDHADDRGEGAAVNALGDGTLLYVAVEVAGPTGKEYVLALEDIGSNATLLHEEVRKKIGAQGQKLPLCMTTPGGKSSHPESQSVSLKIRGDYDQSRQETMNHVRTVSDINLAPVTINVDFLKKKYPHLRNVPLKSFTNQKPKMLIGSSHYQLINPIKTVEGKLGEPVAVRTRLGWAVVIPDRHGIGKFKANELASNHVTTNINVMINNTEVHHDCNPSPDDDMHQLIKKSFAVEDFGVKVVEKLRSKEDQRAMKIMESTTRRADEDGIRFQTGLLWKKDDIHLPESRRNAYHRLMCQERKMDRDPEFAAAYCAKMDEYLEKGFIKKLDGAAASITTPKTWYLPHFGVVNPNKPGKLRLVFDAAAKSHGVSLNDNLCQGPDLNNSIISVLLRFRQYEVAYAGDVKDMFHRVIIQKEDRQAQRFLWRGMNRTKEPSTYEMQVMIFGGTSSPTCAQYVKNLAADLKAKEYPGSSQILKKNVYVDDCLHSSPTKDEAIQNINEVISIMDGAGFDICNWTSNSTEVLKSLPPQKLSKEVSGLDLEKCDLPNGRVLGLWWNSQDDYFSYRLNFHKVPKEIISGEQRPTKRQILKLVMSVFDPLGFLAHLLVKAKIILQDVWRAELGWDDEVTDSLYRRWKDWINELHGIPQVKIPRCYSTLIPTAKSIQLHIFCDASEKAYATTAYLRVEKEKEVEVNQVIAKTRVTPLKPLSIPRLELQAALMGCRLAGMIQEELEFKMDEVTFWTDSSTVMAWIRSDARNFKQFVSHRIGEILETTDVNQWRWIPTKLNVADDATRDEEPSDLSQTSRWFCGPEFLRQDECHWPKEKPKMKQDLDMEEMELKPLINAVEIHPPIIDRTKFENYSEQKSDLYHLIRVTAWVLRFLNNIRIKAKDGRNKKPTLTVAEISQAELFWCKLAQRDSFGEELRLLHGGKPIQKTSRILKLDAFLDVDGLLKVNGRLQNAAVPEAVKHPIILDNHHHFTKLLIRHYHERCGHQGIQTVANELRQKYWVLDRISAVKQAFRNCQECSNREAVPIPPRMADLPPARLESGIRPFTNCGLDYFGPMEVLIGRRHEKRWGALFTCLSTRAVHVEIANSLTSDSAINAIRRMGNRRGHPSHIYCDNGTNFKGAETELKKALQEVDHDKIEMVLKNRAIQFHYNPPAAPHMGGAWERMVGSIKKVLKGILKETVPAEEILHTFLTEAENIVNSRPLTNVSVDPNDPEALTPNHFLLGWTNGCAQNKPISQPIIGDFEESDLLLRQKWRAAQRMADKFWQQWIRDYLPTLTGRAKWIKNVEQLQVDDIVLVVDDQAPRNSWQMGRIVACHFGKDGQVRSVDVKTSSGIYRRPAVKIALLKVRKDQPQAKLDESSSPTAIIGGKNVGD